MTLPAPRLDDRSFQDIVDDAKRHIHRLCPEWTDHNVSDPGVALIELFAWMTELMLYRLNQVPDRLYVKFLELFGIELQGTAAASTVLLFHLTAPQAQPVRVPVRTQVATDRIGTEQPVVFLTEGELVVNPPHLVSCLTRTGQQVSDHTEALRLRTGPMVCFATLTRGDAFYLGFSDPLAGNLIRIRVVTGAEGAGIDPERPPLRWQCWTGQVWRTAAVLSDTSNALNAVDGGEITLLLPPQHEPMAMGQTRAYWIRCRLIDPPDGAPTYQRSPEIHEVSVVSLGGAVTARHAEPAPPELLGLSTGEPGQRFTLSRRPVLPREPGEHVEIVSTDADGDDTVEPWTEVAHFGDCGPDDHAYTLSETTGEITFGPQVRRADGSYRQYGAVVPLDARIRFTGYRHGGGAAGNVAARRLSVLRTSIPFVARVTNLVAAAGGVDAETIENAKVRGPLTLRSGDRAVTAQDFERLTRTAAPTVARARCLAPEGPEPVRVLVVPASVVPARSMALADLAMSEDLGAEITRYLDQRRLLTTQVRVEEPFYQGIMAVAQLSAVPGMRTESVRDAALDALYGFLNPLTGGRDGSGWPFGQALTDGDVHARLRAVPGVQTVSRVYFFLADLASGQVDADELQQVDLPRDALPLSFRHQVVVS